MLQSVQQVKTEYFAIGNQRKTGHVPTEGATLSGAFTAGPLADRSLETPVDRGPKVQGVAMTPNLSGKRTELFNDSRLLEPY